MKNLPSQPPKEGKKGIYIFLLSFLPLFPPLPYKKNLSRPPSLSLLILFHHRNQ